MKIIRFGFVISFICAFLSFPLMVMAETVTEEWVKLYDGGNLYNVVADTVVDDAGNSYVTGYSSDGSKKDFVTVKYDTNGNEVWVTQYDKTTNDQPYAIALDGDGNVYVTGYSINYGSSMDFATVKYDTNGNELWVRYYNGPSNRHDYATSIAVDSSGNVYVSGNSRGGWPWDYATVKYDTNGNELWAKRYNGSGNSYDTVSDIAVDDAGNIFVTGTGNDSTTGNDYTTIKYDTDGNELWLRQYNGASNFPDGASSIIVDAAGNSYVTGYSSTSGSNKDFATVKYDAEGNELWVSRYTGPGGRLDFATNIALDNAGNVFVTGRSQSSSWNNAYVYATIKYDTNGNEQWIKKHGPLATYSNPSDIEVDNTGNIYVTGMSGSRFSTIKYDTDGNELWLEQYASLESNTHKAIALGLDSAGNAYVTGYKYTYDGHRTWKDYSYVTIKYSSGVTDTDGDGIPDISDNCVYTPNPDQANNDEDGKGNACDPDDDNDGVLDGADNCPFNPNPDQLDTDGDGAGDVCDGDLDGDDIINEEDNCPVHPNTDQTDTDGDGEGDECDANDDNDEHLDVDDNCPTVVNNDQADMDGDGIGNVCDIDIDGDGKNNEVDNCPLTSNSDQDDTDGDGLGNACDPDDDNDGYLDESDNCPFVSNDQSDLDGDGRGNACDGDLDGDDIANEIDNCPTTPNSSQLDTDTDGIGDACDPDIDGDGVNNGADLCADTPLGEIVDPESGCSIAQLAPCEGPQGTTVSWRNHGKYVSRVAKTAESFVELGLITEAEKGAIVSAAANSSCGK